MNKWILIILLFVFIIDFPIIFSQFPNINKKNLKKHKNILKKLIFLWDIFLFDVLLYIRSVTKIKMFFNFWEKVNFFDAVAESSWIWAKIGNNWLKKMNSGCVKILKQLFMSMCYFSKNNF